MNPDTINKFSQFAGLNAVHQWNQILIKAGIRNLYDCSIQQLTSALANAPMGLRNEILYLFHSNKLDIAVQNLINSSHQIHTEDCYNRDLKVLSKRGQYLKYCIRMENLIAHGPFLLGPVEMDERWLERALEEGKLGWIAVAKEPFCIYVFKGLCAAPTIDSNERIGVSDGGNNFAIRLPHDHPSDALELLPLHIAASQYSDSQAVHEYVSNHLLKTFKIDIENGKCSFQNDLIMFLSEEKSVQFRKKKENSFYTVYGYAPSKLGSDNESIDKFNGLDLDISNPYLITGALDWEDIISRLIYTILSLSVPSSAYTKFMSGCQDTLTGDKICIKSTFTPKGASTSIALPELSEKASTSIKIKPVDVETTCCICFEKYNSNEHKKTILKNCVHYLCLSCIVNVTECPLCRTKV